jgi:hypothetical protein
MCTSKLLVERKKKENKRATTRRFQTKKALGTAAEGQCFIGKSRLEMLQNQSRVGAREEQEQEDCVSRD